MVSQDLVNLCKGYEAPVEEYANKGLFRFVKNMLASALLSLFPNFPRNLLFFFFWSTPRNLLKRGMCALCFSIWHEHE